MGNQQRVIPVLGMHRSGTSVITRGLLTLGVSLGDGPMAEAFDNPKGFWEDMDIVNINERLLEVLGMKWHSIRLIDPHEFNCKDVEGLKLEAIQLIRNRFGSYPVWGFKDPRTSRLLPFWKSVFGHLAIHDSYLVVIRNPLSVARSLYQRNGFQPVLSYLLWLEHYAQGLSEIENKMCAVVDYDKFMENPHDQLQRIASHLEIPSDNYSRNSIETFISDFISLNLRHSIFRPEDIKLDSDIVEITGQLYNLLYQVATDHVSLKGIINDVQEIGHALKSLKPILNYFDQQKKDTVINEIGSGDPENLSASDSLIENLKKEIHIRDLEILKRDDMIKELSDEYEERNSLIENLKKEISRRDEEVYFLKGQISTLENKLNAILSSKTWKIGQFYGRIVGVESPLRRNIGRFFKKKVELVDKETSSLNSYQDEEPREIEPLTTKQYDVICLPIIDWFFRFQRPQQILSQFAKNNSRVFYINPKFSSERDRYFQIKEIQTNIFDIIINANPSLNIYRDSIDEGNLNAMMRSFKALRRELGIVEAICIVQLPFWQPLAKKIKEEFGWKLIYDCMDEHSGFSTNTESSLSFEEDLARDCDLLVVTSNLLHEKMKIYNRNCIVLPNAADFDHFSYLPPNDLLKEFRKPIIGYYGAISDWFDNELVEYLAISKKQWSFVFIGHTFGSNISKLKKMKNVFFLGEKPYNDLPKFLYWFDVCIIPFKLNKLTKATNPIKFYEFMCSGKRVVSVELPELLPYAKYLYIAKDKKDFLRKIEAALEEKDPNLTSERIQLAKENTWEERYKILSSEIKKIYPKASIIIVTYNNLDYTKLCINSIFSNTQYPNIEIIVVDNNSTDGTKEYLKELAFNYPDLKIILNESNEGFARANNKGILASSGEYVVFLNNDTIVTRGWLTRLIKHLENEAIGMVGPVTNFCGNEAKIDVPYNTIDDLREFSEKYIRDHIDSKGFDIKMLAMYCVAMRKNVIDEVGLLDERFEVGMFEDDDFSHRVRLKGYRIICAEDVFIHHFGEASFNKLKNNNNEYRRIFEENKRRFEEKWGIKWEPHKYR